MIIFVLLFLLCAFLFLIFFLLKITTHKKYFDLLDELNNNKGIKKKRSFSQFHERNTDYSWWITDEVENEELIELKKKANRYLNYSLISLSFGVVIILLAKAFEIV